MLRISIQPHMHGLVV